MFLEFHTNIKFDTIAVPSKLKWLTVANTLAYSGTEIITDVKSFMVIALALPTNMRLAEASMTKKNFFVIFDARSTFTRLTPVWSSSETRYGRHYT